LYEIVKSVEKIYPLKKSYFLFHFFNVNQFKYYNMRHFCPFGTNTKKNRNPHLLDNASHKGLLKTEQAQNPSIMQTVLASLPQQQPMPAATVANPSAESKNHSVK
jgi:hypothetical protein